MISTHCLINETPDLNQTDVLISAPYHHRQNSKQGDLLPAGLRYLCNLYWGALKLFRRLAVIQHFTEALQFVTLLQILTISQTMQLWPETRRQKLRPTSASTTAQQCQHKKVTHTLKNFKHFKAILKSTIMRKLFYWQQLWAQTEFQSKYSTKENANFRPLFLCDYCELLHWDKMYLKQCQSNLKQRTTEQWN